MLLILPPMITRRLARLLDSPWAECPHLPRDSYVVTNGIRINKSHEARVLEAKQHARQHTPPEAMPCYPKENATL